MFKYKCINNFIIRFNILYLMEKELNMFVIIGIGNNFLDRILRVWVLILIKSKWYFIKLIICIVMDIVSKINCFFLNEKIYLLYMYCIEVYYIKYIKSLKLFFLSK